MPRKPHTCPTCKGKQPAKADCDTCDHSGVVWEPDELVQAVSSHDTAGNPTDLTYRPR